ncbi:MAG: GLUG motif-containing protein [Planctomycetota bacterium]|jgi:hypothetical protein
MSETRISSLLRKITVFVVICCCCLPSQAKYGGGSGTPEDPYQIWDANHMQAIGADANDWDKHFILMADIDLSGYTGTSFNIIGIGDFDHPFTGVFDGNGRKIFNFIYTSTGGSNIGLFGCINDPNAELKNLGLIDPNVAGTGSYVGSLVGYLREATISNCYIEGGSVAGDYYVGGLVGCNYRGTITNCFSSGSVSGFNLVGGLVGRTQDGTITSCYSEGSVSGYERVGGLVGWSYGDGTITNSYSTGSVSGHEDIGGLVGWSYRGTITNSYSTGSVSGNERVGGLVGDNSGHVISSYWDIETSGQADSAGGKGKTTAQMMMADTFLHWGACGQVWTIDEGVDYPRLSWEQRPGDPIVGIIPLEGDGDPNNPYLIYTAEELNVIGLLPCIWDKHFKLMANLDLSQYTGTEFNIIVRFIGTFNGNGHTISNFTYASTVTDYIGLFGYIYDPNAEIKNLCLIDPNVDAGEIRGIVGSLVGRLDNGTITNCYVEGGIVWGMFRIGGLVGRNNYGTISNSYSTCIVSGGGGGLVAYNYEGTINNCYSTGSVSGEDHVGGLVGFNVRGTINNCYSSGSVSGDDEISGLVGYNSGGTITNCYSSGNVSGDRFIGGLVGRNRYGTITNCYSKGSVTGTTDVGGLVGHNQYGEVTNSFWDIETSGQSDSAGGKGKTTAQMMMADTFLHWGTCGQVWTIDEGVDYPRLVWEQRPGEPIVGIIPLEGDGDPNNPYLIYTAEELNVIGLLTCVLDKHFKLMANLDLSQYTGIEFNIIVRFSGTFDGNGHTISNFTYTSTGTDYIGLFGKVTGVIKNLGLIDPNLDVGTGWYVGSLVGRLDNGTINNCYIEGGIVSGETLVGGLVGHNNGTITNCSATGSISGYERVGGLVGDNYEGTIINNCYSTGSVSGDRYVGGLVGDSEGAITNSYSTGSVSGYERVGGLVGEHGSGSDDIITTSYATGSVTGNDSIGGLVGCNYGTISTSYSTGSVAGDRYVGGLVGENDCTITNSYSTGSVSGDYYVGGLVGENSSDGIITNCYSKGSVTGNYSVGGLVGYDREGSYTKSFWDKTVNSLLTGIGNAVDPNVFGESTTNMQTESTFTDAGWDFVGETVNGPNDIWDICEGTNYPKFLWQIPIADFLCPDGVDFIDYSFFASHWAEENCGASNDCDGRDLDLLGSVDIKDLRIFVDNWMRGF